MVVDVIYWDSIFQGSAFGVLLFLVVVFIRHFKLSSVLTKVDDYMESVLGNQEKRKRENARLAALARMKKDEDKRLQKIEREKDERFNRYFEEELKNYDKGKKSK